MTMLHTITNAFKGYVVGSIILITIVVYFTMGKYGPKDVLRKSCSELPNPLARAIGRVGVLIFLGQAFTTREISEKDENIGPNVMWKTYMYK